MDLEKIRAQANLTPEQQRATAGMPVNQYLSDAGVFTQPMPVADLGKSAITEVPPAPDLTQQYKNAFAGAMASANTPPPAPITPPTTETPKQEPKADTSFSSFLSKYLPNGAGTTAPTSIADQFKTLADAQGLAEKQKEVNDLQAQLNAITAETTAEQLKLETQDVRRTGTVLGRQQGQIAREQAIKALPVSAALNAAQGRLETATSNINTLLGLVKSDQESKYKYENDLIDRAIKFATADQQQALAERKAELEAQQSEFDNFSKISKTYVDAAIAAGDFATAGKLATAKTPEEIETLASQIKSSNKDIQIISSDGGIYAVDKNNPTQVVTLKASTTNPIPTPGRVSATTQAIIDNPSLFDDLTSTERGKVIKELQTNGYDTTTLGLKGLSDTAIQSIAQSQKALTDLTNLRQIIADNTDKLGPITGLARFNPYSEVRKIQADIDRVRQTVGKALEGGVLRKEDEEKYKKILVTLAHEPETALYKIDALVSSLQRDIENYKSMQVSSGRVSNVTGSLPKKGSSSTPDSLRAKYDY